jgi:HEAT repeat protein
MSIPFNKLTQSVFGLVIAYLFQIPEKLGKVRAVDRRRRNWLSMTFPGALLGRVVKIGLHHELKMGAIRAVARLRFASSDVAVEDERAVLAIADVLRNETQKDDVRRWALAVMFQMCGFEALAAVIRDSSTDSRRIIRQFVQSFCEGGPWMQFIDGQWQSYYWKGKARLSTASEVAKVAKYLHDSDPVVRACAAHFLMRMSTKGDCVTIRALAALAEDEARCARFAVARALRKIAETDDEVANNALDILSLRPQFETTFSSEI